MAQKRTNFTLTEINYAWLRQQSPTERGMSRVLDDLIQRTRIDGPVNQALVANTEKLREITDGVLKVLAWVHVDMETLDTGIFPIDSEEKEPMAECIPLEDYIACDSNPRMVKICS